MHSFGRPELPRGWTHGNLPGVSVCNAWILYERPAFLYARVDGLPRTHTVGLGGLCQVNAQLHKRLFRQALQGIGERLSFEFRKPVST